MTMADTLEQRFDAINVQDENYGSIPPQHKTKVVLDVTKEIVLSLTLPNRVHSLMRSHYQISAPQHLKVA